MSHLNPDDDGKYIGSIDVNIGGFPCEIELVNPDDHYEIRAFPGDNYGEPFDLT